MGTFTNSEDPDEMQHIGSTMFVKVKKDLQTKKYNVGYFKSVQTFRLF